MPTDHTSTGADSWAPEDFKVDLVYQHDLTDEQRRDVRQLQASCFSDVPYEELMEDFVAPSIAKVLAYSGHELLGCVSVFKRRIEHEGRQILLGGFGGTCTREDMRGRGIGTRVCEVAMECLRREGCDIAMLAVGPASGTDKFYERFGFRLLGRPFVFVTASGRLKTPERDVAMVAPMLSEEVFDHVTRTRSPLNIGPEEGYW
jgi:GNAT superfamily N-acetyltransferase